MMLTIPGCSRCPDRRPWLAAGLLCSLLLQPLVADDTPDSRVSRLGFKFDQKAHDAAMAAANQPNDANEATPPGVIQLPKHTVTEKGPALRPYEILTPQGRVEVAKKRYETPFYQAVIGPLEALASLINNPLGGWSPNAPEALALYEDDERKRRANEMNDLLDLAALADAAKSPADANPAPNKASK